jgi:hypothetical protein
MGAQLGVYGLGGAAAEGLAATPFKGMRKKPQVPQAPPVANNINTQTINNQQPIYTNNM